MKTASDERNTRQQGLVLKAIYALNGHPTAEQVYLHVRKFDKRISQSTVYRNLNKLVNQGVLQLVKAPVADRFEVRIDRHYHFICSVCGAISDVDLTYDETIDHHVASSTGGVITHHRTTFEGICSHCRKD